MFDGVMDMVADAQHNSRKRALAFDDDDVTTSKRASTTSRAKENSTPPNTCEAPPLTSTPQMFGMSGREMFYPHNIPGMFFPGNMQSFFDFATPTMQNNGFFNKTFGASDDSGVVSDAGSSPHSEETTADRAESTESSERSESRTGQTADTVDDEEDERSRDSTVELFVKDENKPPVLSRPAVILSPMETFATVPGRMTLLAAATKYKVTIGEIHRRISPPECLHASLVNGILRRAKAKDGNKTLRMELNQIGLSLPSGRRKMAPATAFTALCEEEAVGMARDFQMLAAKQFPSTKMAEYMVQKRAFSPQEVHKLKMQFIIAKEMMQEMCCILQSVPEYPKDFEPASVIMDPAQTMVNYFSLVTHGFGHNALAAAAQTFATVADRGIKYADMFMGTRGLACPGVGNIPPGMPGQPDLNWL